MEVSLTQQEAIQVVGCLKICSELDGGIDELIEIADRITNENIEEMKREMREK